MNRATRTIKRLIIYVIGLFFLSLGVSFSIFAGLGVSPVSSLAYAFSLSSGVSVGIMTVVANILFIVIQILLNKKNDVKEYTIQLISSILFGSFMDLTVWIVSYLPETTNLITRFGYVIASLFIVSIGLLFYFTAKFPLMPYDALTYAISSRFKFKFSKAKISSDLLNVCIAGIICLIFIGSLGSIGIGTLIAAYFIGKIVGFLLGKYQPSIIRWAFGQ